MKSRIVLISLSLIMMLSLLIPSANTPSAEAQQSNQTQIVYLSLSPTWKKFGKGGDEQVFTASALVNGEFDRVDINWDSYSQPAGCFPILPPTAYGFQYSKDVIAVRSRTTVFVAPIASSCEGWVEVKIGIGVGEEEKDSKKAKAFLKITGSDP